MELFDDHRDTVLTTYSFMDDDTSEPLAFDKNRLQAFRDSTIALPVEYGYDQLFDYDQAIAGIQVDHSVKNHAFCALDSEGKLTKEHLFDIVRANNSAYLTKMTSLIKDVDDARLGRICEILTDVINDTLAKYPDIDKDRVYCNLGNLKVVEKGGALDFAAVEPGMVLHINKNTSNMVGILSSSNMYSVLVHEAMHIIQFGCQCEQVEDCIRRCGLAHAYSSREQDHSDWIWLAEGSAERMACLYANVEPMTYTNYVNYISTLDLATMLRQDVPVNYVETLYFYDDLDRLFALFGAATDEQKQEIYRMIYALEIMQSEPTDVKSAYQKHYGTEWSDQIRDQLNNDVKRPIVQTLTKCFYSNLAESCLQQDLSKNDLLFLLNLYDTTINYHLRLNVSNHDAYNADFAVWYSTLQNDLFSCFENVSPDDYQNYVADAGQNKINAHLSWLDAEKKAFLIAKFETEKCSYKFIPQ